MRDRTGSSFSAPLTLAAALLTVSAHLPAQLGEPAGAIGLATVQPLNPGDVVLITVQGEPEESGSFMIGPTGLVSAGPLTGPVEAAGLTLDQLRDNIVDALRQFIRRPLVSVSLDAEKSVRLVHVGGTVGEPGPQTVRYGGSVAEAVMAAGILPTSDLSRVRVSRDGQSLPLDVSSLRGAVAAGPPLPAQAGDMIYVPKLIAGVVAVHGHVVNPGPLALEPEDLEEMTVLRAINVAGGTTEGADLTSAMLLHRGAAPETVNLQALLYEGDMSEDRPMRGGDTLVVRAAKKLTIAGQVADPVSVVVGEQISVLDAVALGGGFTALADLRGVRVVRDSGTEVVDLSGLWERGEVGDDITVGPGDSVIVPERLAEEVLVVGQVKTPGPTDIYKRANRGVLGLVHAAVPLPIADLRHVAVHRPDQPPIFVDVKSIAEEGNFAEDYQAQGGDTIFVPELAKVYVIGAFESSGAFPLTDSTTVVEVVSLAGVRSDAMLGKMRLIRPSAGPGESRTINFKRVQQGRETIDFRLEPGDYLFLPSRDPNKRDWYDWLRDALFFWEVMRR